MWLGALNGFPKQEVVNHADGVEPRTQTEKYWFSKTSLYCLSHLAFHLFITTLFIAAYRSRF